MGWYEAGDWYAYDFTNSRSILFKIGESSSRLRHLRRGRYWRLPATDKCRILFLFFTELCGTTHPLGTRQERTASQKEGRAARGFVFDFYVFSPLFKTFPALFAFLMEAWSIKKNDRYRRKTCAIAARGRIRTVSLNYLHSNSGSRKSPCTRLGKEQVKPKWSRLS